MRDPKAVECWERGICELVSIRYEDIEPGSMMVSEQRPHRFMVRMRGRIEHVLINTTVTA